MAKDILAFLGMIFLILLIIMGVASLVFFYDRIGIIEIPDRVTQFISTFTPDRTVTVIDIGVGKAEWSNPLDAIPTSTLTPVPVYTATPVPPLTPKVYETEVMVRLKIFVSALERWLMVNEALTKDNALISDSAWQAEMALALDSVSETGRALADVGPPPPEYEEIDQWLDRVEIEAEGLRARYSQALETQVDPATSGKHFTAASEHFARIKEYLFQAVEGMISAGWSF
jgi:hypothetical protein